MSEAEEETKSDDENSSKDDGFVTPMQEEVNFNENEAAVFASADFSDDSSKSSGLKKENKNDKSASKIAGDADNIDHSGDDKPYASHNIDPGAETERVPEIVISADYNLSGLLSKGRKFEVNNSQDVPKTIGQAEHMHTISNQREYFTCFCCQKNKKTGFRPEILYVATNKGIVFRYNYSIGSEPVLLEIDPGWKITDIDCLLDDNRSEFLLVLSRNHRITICSLPLNGQTIKIDVLYRSDYNYLSSPISCARLDPYFSISTLSFIYGTEDGRVMQHKKAWLQSERTIHTIQSSAIVQASKKVTSIAWSADCNLVVWCSQTQCGVLDMTEERIIHKWDRSHNLSSSLSDNLELPSPLASWSFEPPNVSVLYMYSDKVIRVMKFLVEREKYREYTVKQDNIFDVDLAAGTYVLGIVPFYNSENKGNQDHESKIVMLCRGISSEVWLSTVDVDDYSVTTIEISKIKLPSIFQSETPPLLISEWCKGLPISINYFILYEEQLMIGRSASTIDKLNWYLENERLDEALSLASSSLSNKNQNFSDSAIPQSDELVERFLRNLVQKELYDQAAQFLPRLLGRDQQAWTKCAALFAERRKLTKIALSLPTHDPQLPEYIYELTLQEFTENKDYIGCLQTLRNWESVHTSRLNHSSFLNIESLLSLFSLLSKQLPFEPILHDIVADLLAMNGHYNLAVREYIKAAELSNFPPALAMPQDPTDGFSYARRKRSERAFQLIKLHMLLPALTDQVKGLFLLDVEEAVNLLTADDVLGGFEEGGVGITPEIVFEQLSSSSYSSHSNQKRQYSSAGVNHSNMDWALFRYLHSIFRLRQQDYNSERFAAIHTKHVELYAKYEPTRLLEFLQISTFYSIDKALEITRRHKPKPLYDALVYLLGRVGGSEHTHEALRILIEDIHDIPRAIQFVEEQAGDNYDLWIELIKRSVKNNSLLSDLLENAGSHKVDLVLLIKELPRGVKIPNLKYSLTRIFESVQLQLHTLESSNLVVKADVMGLLRQLHQKYQSAIRIDPKHARCRKCNGHIIPNKVIKDIKSSYYRENSHIPYDDSGDVLIFHNGECCHKYCHNNELKSSR